MIVGDRATSTGHGAWSTRWAETEPSTALVTGPSPRLPTTMRSANDSLAMSTSRSAARPPSMDVSTLSPEARSASARSSRTSSRASCSVSRRSPVGGVRPVQSSTGSTAPSSVTRVPIGQLRFATSSQATLEAREPSTPMMMRIVSTSRKRRFVLIERSHLPRTALQSQRSRAGGPFGTHSAAAGRRMMVIR